MTEQERIDKKIEYIHTIYEMAIQETSQELLDLINPNLFYIEGNFISVSKYYKQIYYMIKNNDKLLEKYPEFKDEWSVLRFRLVTVFKGLRNILYREFEVNHVQVGHDENSWMFIC